MAKYINIPFAESGNKTAIPDTTTDGTVNYTDGFGGDYARPLGTDPLAKTVDRETINQALYDYGTAIKQLQENGVFTWQSTKSGGYDVGAIVSLNGVNYENTAAANTATPPNNGWKLLDDATLLNGQPSTFYLPAGNYTATDVLAKIKTVDGSGSGLDADTVDGVQGALLGIGGAGYAWVDETANRAFGVTYTNSTGKPIMILVSTRAISKAQIYASINDKAFIFHIEDSSSSSSTTGTFIVSVGGTYSISKDPKLGTPKINNWLELK